MAKMINLSPTKAGVLKKQAIDCGYLEAKHKFREIRRMTYIDPEACTQLKHLDPDYRRRLSLSTGLRKGKPYTAVHEQLHDEIIPMLTFCMIRIRKKHPMIYGGSARHQFSLNHEMNNPDQNLQLVISTI
jgi:hypothetical protein